MLDAHIAAVERRRLEQKPGDESKQEQRP